MLRHHGSSYESYLDMYECTMPPMCFPHWCWYQRDCIATFYTSSSGDDFLHRRCAWREDRADARRLIERRRAWSLRGETGTTSSPAKSSSLLSSLLRGVPCNAALRASAIAFFFFRRVLARRAIA